jgi:hypothetical protein
VPLCCAGRRLTVPASHLKYTVPPAALLTWLYRPFFTKLDVYKVVYLISVRAGPLLERHCADRPGCRCFDHTLGLVPHPHRHLELSQPCHHWPEAVRHSPRRGLLLRRTDVQHVALVPPPQSAHLPARLPERRAWRLTQPMAIHQACRPSLPARRNRLGMALYQGRQHGHLYGTHTHLGRPVPAAVMVRQPPTAAEPPR